MAYKLEWEIEFFGGEVRFLGMESASLKNDLKRKVSEKWFHPFFILSFFLSSERNRNSSWLMKRQDEAGDGVKTLTQWRIDAMQKVKQAPYQVLFVIIFTVTRTKEPILFLCEALLSTPTLALKALICYQWSLNLGHSPALPALICWDNWPKIIAKLRCEHSSWLQFETSGQSYKAHYARKLRR